MTIVPRCENKLLSGCGSGNLVRPIGYWRSTEFAIVGSVEGEAGCALVLFGEGKPTYATEDQPDQVSVLDYGDRWIMDVDHSGAFEPRPRHMYECPGCLIREKSRWLLNVSSEDEHFRYRRAQFDLTDFQLVVPSSELDNIAVLGKWALYIGDESRSRDAWHKVKEFDWSKREGQAG